MFQKFFDKFPLINFTMKNVFVEHIFALGATNVVAVEWDVKYKTHEGEEFENSGVTVAQIVKGKVVIVRKYIFDVELEKRAWGGCLVESP